MGSSFSRSGKGSALASEHAPEGLNLATFAGGCFWGLELKFQREPGVVRTASGYTSGHVPSPSYEAVCAGKTGHTEAVRVIYDPKSTTYRRLLEAFADQVDMTTPNRQGSDRGTQYRSGIYFHDERQKSEAKDFVQELNADLSSGRSSRGWVQDKVVTEIEPASDFYIAEDYHQQYLAKGGRFGIAQNAEKGAVDKIRCYG